MTLPAVLTSSTPILLKVGAGDTAGALLSGDPWGSGRKAIGMVLTAGIIGGCNILPWGKLHAPESFGVTPVTSGRYC